MKNVGKLLVMLGITALSALALSAKTEEQVYIDTYGGRTDIPVPISVVAPQAPLRGTDSVAKVDLAFIVDEKGNPTQITVLSTTDTLVADAVTEAVAKWKFAPVKRNGEAVPAKVHLPVRLVVAD